MFQPHPAVPVHIQGDAGLTEGEVRLLGMKRLVFFSHEHFAQDLVLRARLDLGLEGDVNLKIKIIAPQDMRLARVPGGFEMEAAFRPIHRQDRRMLGHWMRLTNPVLFREMVSNTNSSLTTNTSTTIVASTITHAGGRSGRARLRKQLRKSQAVKRRSQDITPAWQEPVRALVSPGDLPSVFAQFPTPAVLKVAIMLDGVHLGVTLADPGGLKVGTFVFSVLQLPDQTFLQTRAQVVERSRQRIQLVFKNLSEADRSRVLDLVEDRRGRRHPAPSIEHTG